MLLDLDLKRLRIPAELTKPIALIAAFGAWILLFRLLCLSFIVYFLTREGHVAEFEEINEAFSANELPFIGLGSAFFVLLLQGLAPLIDRERGFGLSMGQAVRSYFPGLFRGACLGASVVAAFLLLGSWKFVGFFVQIEDTPLAILAIVLRTGAILAIVFCEELLFRLRPFSTAGQITIFSLIYCCVTKPTQFELSWMHFLTLFLVSSLLSVRRLNEDGFLNGAGFWSGILIVFHPLFSLPIFGNDFSGIFLLKYQAQRTFPALISGGAGGPLASIAFQAVLLIEIARSYWTYKKSLLKPAPNQ
jgi:hypothetical protein